MMNKLLSTELIWQKLAKKIDLKAFCKEQILANKWDNSTIELTGGSDLDLLALISEGNKALETVKFSLSGSGAKLKLTLIVIGKSTEKFNLKTICEHVTADTEAEITVKAVLFDHSELDYLGNIAVSADGHGTKTNLNCQTLLMSHGARAKTIPSLEIIANDVKASHAASVGRVDDELLFYLESRGYDLETAQKLLIEGFLRDALKGLDEKQREAVWQNILELLPIKL